MSGSPSTSDPEELQRLLDEGETVTAPAAAWARFADSYSGEGRWPTGMAGDIELLARRGAWFVLEHPRDDEVVLRRFASRDEAQRFIDERLAAYERLWDG